VRPGAVPCPAPAALHPAPPQMDNQRNHLMTLSLRMTMLSVAVSLSSLFAGVFGTCLQGWGGGLAS
jgi:hypothetical protein